MPCHNKAQYNAVTTLRVSVQLFNANERLTSHLFAWEIYLLETQYSRVTTLSDLPILKNHAVSYLPGRAGEKHISLSAVQYELPHCQCQVWVMILRSTWRVSVCVSPQQWQKVWLQDFCPPRLCHRKHNLWSLKLVAGVDQTDNHDIFRLIAKFPSRFLPVTFVCQQCHATVEGYLCVFSPSKSCDRDENAPNRAGEWQLSAWLESIRAHLCLTPTLRAWGDSCSVVLHCRG